MTQLQQPTIQERGEQHYVALLRSGTVDDFSSAVDGSYPALFAWLGERGVEPSGAPFIRYLAFDPEGAFEIELGVPVAEPVAGAGEVRDGVLPAGRYVTYLHPGAYFASTPQWEGRDLGAAQGHVRSWIAEQGIPVVEDTTVERYLVGPPIEADVEAWRTELLVLVRD